MKKIKLNINEQFKYETVKAFVDNSSINYKNLALKLNCNLKTAYYLYHQHISLGKVSSRHKNHNKKLLRTISSNHINKVIEIYSSLGIDINLPHFTHIYTYCPLFYR